MPRQARILLVDDHPIVREGLAQLIQEHGGFVVCGEAEDADQAMELVPQLKPDLVIVDVSLANSNGLELVKQFKTHFPDLPALVLSMHDETVYAPRALQAGARGYVMKREARQSIVKAIQRVLEGGIYVSDSMSAHFLEQVAGGKPSARKGGIARLTDRELQVFELIGNGKSTRQIAELLHRSVKTVEAHREHIKEKLALDNAAELNRLAYQWVQTGSAEATGEASPTS
jgi:DNA-binding NarL/FixJ family response regulator